MNRKGVILFYILTYAFAWGLSALFLLFPVWMLAHFGRVTLWNPIVFATIWTPTIWAFVLAFALDGRAGLRDLLIRVFRWRVGLRWYLISTVGIAALGLTATLVRTSVSHTPLPPDFIDVATWPALAGYGLSLLVLDPGPIGEDPGWRGYALPRMLQRFNPAVASVLLGSVWAAWHLPAFLFSGMPQAPLSAGWFLLEVVALTVMMSWVAINTRGAVIPAILMHWASNRFTILEGQGGMYTAIIYTVAAIVIIAATRGRLGLRQEKGNAADLQVTL
jgi:membrane protease YdiL (CAAX protease family)